MELRRFASAAAFLDVAQAWLESREVENSLMLGLAVRFAAAAAAPVAAPYYATLVRGTDPCFAVLMTPPHRLILAGAHADAASAAQHVAADLRRAGLVAPGVIGRKDTAVAFAAPAQLAWVAPVDVPQPEVGRRRLGVAAGRGDLVGDACAVGRDLGVGRPGQVVDERVRGEATGHRRVAPLSCAVVLCIVPHARLRRAWDRTTFRCVLPRFTGRAITRSIPDRPCNGAEAI